MKKYHMTFEFRKTEEEAQKLANEINKNATYYMRKNKPAHFTPWESSDHKEKLFVVWYWY